MSNSRRLRRSVAASPPQTREAQPTPVWYGVCRHWTENWSVLTGDLPRCPIDGAPGFHADETWWPSVDAYEANGHPGYRAEVEALRIGGRLTVSAEADAHG